MKVATCNLSQWAMDFKGNRERIIESIKIAKAQGCTYRLGPELEVTGYGCEDHFYEIDTINFSWKTLGEILNHTENILVDIGMPVMHQGIRYNCRVFCLNKKILLIRPKMWLADDGNYRETRWFTPWSKERISILENYVLPDEIQKITGQTDVKFGVGIIQGNDASVASETCEELFTPESIHILLSQHGVDVVSNGSGSHFQIGKRQRRHDLMSEATKTSGGAYMYSNMLGCDGSRLVFDGNGMIYQSGKLLAVGEHLSFQEVEVVTAVLNLNDIRANRASIVSIPRQGALRDTTLKRVNIDDYFPSEPKFRFTMRDLTEYKSTEPIPVPTMEMEREMGLASARYMWDYLTRGPFGGCFLPLSGGVDSSSTAMMVYFMADEISKILKIDLTSNEDKKRLQDLTRKRINANILKNYPAYQNNEIQTRELMYIILHTCNMPTNNNTEEIKGNAARLARSLGSFHMVAAINEPFVAIKNMVGGPASGPNTGVAFQAKIDDAGMKNDEIEALRSDIAKFEAEIRAKSTALVAGDRRPVVEKMKVELNKAQAEVDALKAALEAYASIHQRGGADVDINAIETAIEAAADAATTANNNATAAKEYIDTVDTKIFNIGFINIIRNTIKTALTSAENAVLTAKLANKSLDNNINLSKELNRIKAKAYLSGPASTLTKTLTNLQNRTAITVNYAEQSFKTAKILNDNTIILTETYTGKKVENTLDSLKSIAEIHSSTAASAFRAAMNDKITANKKFNLIKGKLPTDNHTGFNADDEKAEEERAAAPAAAAAPASATSAASVSASAEAPAAPAGAPALAAAKKELDSVVKELNSLSFASQFGQHDPEQVINLEKRKEELNTIILTLEAKAKAAATPGEAAAAAEAAAAQAAAATAPVPSAAAAQASAAAAQVAAAAALAPAASALAPGAAALATSASVSAPAPAPALALAAPAGAAAPEVAASAASALAPAASALAPGASALAPAAASTAPVQAATDPSLKLDIPRYKMTANGDWLENLSIQNIQARLRMITAYYLAQILPLYRWNQNVLTQPVWKQYFDARALAITAAKAEDENQNKLPDDEVRFYEKLSDEMKKIHNDIMNKRPNNSPPLLVLASSNADECLRGFYTKYDAGSGDLNPIGSYSKTHLRMFLNWCMRTYLFPGTKIPQFGVIKLILDTVASPELTPSVDGSIQDDEIEIGMTYEDLYEMGLLRKDKNLGALSMFLHMCEKKMGKPITVVGFEKVIKAYDPKYETDIKNHNLNFKPNPEATYKIKVIMTATPRNIADKVKEFFRQYGMNRNKMTIITPSIHATSYSPDDNRYDHRPFLYPALQDEIAQIELLVQKMTSAAAKGGSTHATQRNRRRPTKPSRKSQSKKGHARATT